MAKLITAIRHKPPSILPFFFSTSLSYFILSSFLQQYKVIALSRWVVVHWIFIFIFMNVNARLEPYFKSRFTVCYRLLRTIFMPSIFSQLNAPFITIMSFNLRYHDIIHFHVILLRIIIRFTSCLLDLSLLKAFSVVEYFFFV